MDIDQAEAIVRVEKGSKSVSEMSSKELQKRFIRYLLNEKA